MLTAEHLAEFTKLAFERLARHVAERDPIAPRAFGAKVVGGKVVLSGDSSLDDESFTAERIPAAVNSLLALPEVEVVGVAHEAWASKIPGMPSELLAMAMGHLAWNKQGKAEVVIFALHGEGFQTAVMHAVLRDGGKRRLAMGPLMFDALTMGGAMSRPMPTKH